MKQTKDRGTMAGAIIILIPLAIFLCIAFFLKLLYSLPLKDSLLWYVGVFFYFYIPGSLLLRCLDLNKDEYFVKFFHSIALGAALMPLVYITLRRLSHPELLYIFGVVMFLLWFILNIRDLKDRKNNVYTSYRDILSAVVLIVAVFLLLHLSHFTDVVFLENGFKIRNIYLTENIFYLGIINNLRDMFPPIYPYASGVNFSHYHLNMPLEIEMFNRFFSIDTLKLTFFYFPLLYFCLLVFVPYIFIRKNWNVRFLGVLTGILIFGSDLSFIPGLLGMSPPNYPWTLFFRTTIWSLYTLNGNLPALFVMFLCIFYLKRYYEDGRLSYILIFALLGFSAYGFKSSMGPHIMGATFLTGIVSVVIMKDRKKGKLLCVVSALTVLAMAIDVIIFRGNTDNIIFGFDLFNHFYYSLGRLGVSGVPWVFYPMIFPLYILGTFGIRALGFYLLKDVFKKTLFDPIVIFLTVFSILGFLISEVIFIGSPAGKINNADWFSIQSLMGAWLLLSYFLFKLRHYGNRFFGLVVVIILFSAPTTVQFLTLRFDHSYYTVESNAMEVVSYLKTTQPESVVLHPPNLQGPSLASNLAGRPSVISLFRSFSSLTVGEKEFANRLNSVKLFFKRDYEINRSFILQRYKVDYVYAPLLYADIFDKEPMLLQVLKNGEYVLYKVDRANNSL